MAEQQTPRHRPGPFAPLFAVFSGALLAVFAGVLIGCVLHAAGQAWLWPQEGPARARTLLEADLASLRPFERSVLPGVGDPLQFAQRAALAVGAASGLPRLLDAAVRQSDAGSSQRKLGVDAAGLLRTLAPALAATYYVLQSVTVRVVIAVLALPALCLALCLALIDGLGRRDIRRWTGGRESSFTYHLGKRYLWPTATLAFTVYLVWPLPGFSPVMAVLIGYGLAALTVGLMAATFKKYL